MTKGIVDLFKTVDVKKQQITFAALLRFVDPALALLHQHPAVRQVRQRIIIGQILDQSFVALIVSDIGTAHHMGQSAVHPAERRAEHPEPGTVERALIIPGIDLRRFAVLIDQLLLRAESTRPVLTREQHLPALAPQKLRNTAVRGRHRTVGI